MRILVVDDAEDVRLLLMGILRGTDSDLISAANGQQAIELMDELHVDLVLLDVMLPDMDGYTVLEWIRARHSMADLPVIIVTGLKERGEMVHALELGANDFLLKPFDPKVVQARVNTNLSLKRFSDHNRELVSITSHDLKKNIALIGDIALDVLSKQSDQTSLGEIYDSVALIQSAADSMKRITHDFLELHVIQSGSVRLFKTSMSINQMIQQEVNQDVVYAKRKGIKLVSELGDVPLIEADAVRIEQVLGNLIGNAIKFSSSGTCITVRSFSDDGKVVVEVIDEGPGFRDKELAAVFLHPSELSNRPTGDEQSTGMGLTICANFIVLHGGKIGVRNNQNRGATFWFSLPSESELMNPNETKKQTIERH